ncbi:hypothetical protein ACLOJK_022571 [Asimina triloba]
MGIVEDTGYCRLWSMGRISGIGEDGRWWPDAAGIYRRIEGRRWQGRWVRRLDRAVVAAARWGWQIEWTALVVVVLKRLGEDGVGCGYRIRAARSEEDELRSRWIRAPHLVRVILEGVDRLTGRPAGACRRQQWLSTLVKVMEHHTGAPAVHCKPCTYNV